MSTPTITPDAVPCPKCHASKGAQCTTTAGEPCGPHAIRRRYAARGWEQLELPWSAAAHARSTDPETSHEAAESITPARLRASQREVLWLLRTHGPMTDQALEDTAARLGVRQSPSGLRTRRAELVAQGRVEWTGETQWLVTGRRSRVWRTTTEGTDA